MSDKRKIRCDGQELGEFNLQKLFQMRNNDEIDHKTEFFSVKNNSWLPLAGILADMEETQSTVEKVAQMKTARFQKVAFVGSDTDCPSCTAIAAAKHLIDAVPSIPPPDCTCDPWCRLCVVGPD